MADHTGSSQVAGPSTRADPEPPLDRDDSDSDSMSNCGISVEGLDRMPAKRRQPHTHRVVPSTHYKKLPARRLFSPFQGEAVDKFQTVGRAARS